MTATERKLAKTFFFFALSGAPPPIPSRRRRASSRTRPRRGNFRSSKFFQVTGSGGTSASSAFQLARELLAKHYEPSQYNGYLFYASDGENAIDDRQLAAGRTARAARAAQLHRLHRDPARAGRATRRRTCAALLSELSRQRRADRQSRGIGQHDVWQALRQFFVAAGRRGGLMATMPTTRPRRVRGARRSAGARRSGSTYHRVDFELVPERFMMEIAVYGLPVRMPHWSFGVRYIHQLVRATWDTRGSSR